MCPMCHFGYERVYLPLWKVADTPFHIQGDELQWVSPAPTFALGLVTHHVVAGYLHPENSQQTMPLVCQREVLVTCLVTGPLIIQGWFATL